MVNYGDEDTLEVLINSIAADVSDDLLALALEAADAWILSKSDSISMTSVPVLVEKAATYYAYSFILRNLYDTNGEDSQTAIKFESMAIELLGAYIEQNSTEESTIHPYSGSLTPTHAYTERILRYVRDDDETEHYDVDDDEWIAEG